MSERSSTVDGLETTMATNHFGPFLFTHLLLGRLKVLKKISGCDTERLRMEKALKIGGRISVTINIHIYFFSESEHF